MAAPAAPPLTPKPFAVVSNVVLALITTFEPIVMVEAVKIVPLIVTELGAEIVKDPRTIKVSPAVLLIVKVPVLLNVNA